MGEMMYTRRRNNKKLLYISCKKVNYLPINQPEVNEDAFIHTLIISRL